jgi:hypothetical protein
LTTGAKKGKDAETCEANSTRQLADAKNNLREDYIHRDLLTGIHTTILSNTDNWKKPGVDQLEPSRIHVQEETLVKIESV